MSQREWKPDDVVGELLQANWNMRTDFLHPTNLLFADLSSEVQAALKSQPDEKCEGVLIFSAGMGEVNGKPGFVPNEPARMHCSGCGGSSGDGQGQQEAALREALTIIDDFISFADWCAPEKGPIRSKAGELIGKARTFKEALSTPATPKHTMRGSNE
jgi:hypothetical protein